MRFIRGVVIASCNLKKVSTHLNELCHVMLKGNFVYEVLHQFDEFMYTVNTRLS